ncbi:MAG: FadR/GntR family transcriptional regulator [Sporolactobacillus sp.]
MPIEHIKQKKIYEKIADTLIAMIHSGELKPGDRMESVGDLAEQFGVGRSAVREAMSALRAMGLVEIRQGEGTFVRSFSPDIFSHFLSAGLLMEKKDMEELLDMRELLEIGAAGWAAEKRDNKALMKIEQALHSMKGIDGDGALGEQSDLNFHMSVADAAQNRLLAQLMISVSGAIAELMKETRRIWIYSQNTAIVQMYQEHRVIFDAIAANGVEKARQAMALHLSSVRKILMTPRKQQK